MSDEPFQIVWKNPPKPARPVPVRPSRWKEIADQLRERPGEWALIGHWEWTSTVTILRNYGVMATVRGVRGGKARDLYGCYVGDALLTRTEEESG